MYSYFQSMIPTILFVYTGIVEQPKDGRTSFAQALSPQARCNLNMSSPAYFYDGYGPTVHCSILSQIDTLGFPNSSCLKCEDPKVLNQLCVH